MTSPAAKSRGFTLLEMLIATAMVAVLAGSLYATLGAAFRARSAALEAVDTVWRGNLALELVRADLQSAVVPGGTLAGVFVATSGAGMFGSGTDELTFSAAAGDIEPGFGAGDIKEITYSCQAGASGQGVLVRQISPYLLATTAVDPNVEIICRGVQGFTLRYFDGTAWQDGWDSNSTGNILPLAVEVTIELAGPAGQSAAANARSSGPPPTVFSQVISIPCGLPADSNLANVSGLGSMGGLP